MKNLTQLFEIIKNEDLPEIYCDLDEVLVDFVKAADAAVGGNFAQTDKKTRWNTINQTKGFWANLDWKPNAKRLHDFIIRYNPHVLSAYTNRDPVSKTGKMKWVKKNTGFKRANIHLVLRSQKQAYAKTIEEKPNILIDDYNKNIEEWESAGGIGILHTDVGKTINKLKGLGFK
jgi:5'(3')-deoxyribonucleotidase